MDTNTKAIKIFFDGACPLCAREMKFLEKKDTENKLTLIDIAAADFSAEEFGLTQERLMAEMHGQLASGEIIVGMEVFRQAYSAIGYKIILLTKLPIIRQVFDFAYRIFAKNRLTISSFLGREKRNCNSGSCAPR